MNDLSVKMNQLRDNTTVRAKKSVFLTFFFWTEGKVQQFSRGMLNLTRSTARTMTGANLKLKKKIYVIYISVASEPRRGF